MLGQTLTSEWVPHIIRFLFSLTDPSDALFAEESRKKWRCQTSRRSRPGNIMIENSVQKWIFAFFLVGARRQNSLNFEVISYSLIRLKLISIRETLTLTCNGSVIFQLTHRIFRRQVQDWSAAGCDSFHREYSEFLTAYLERYIFKQLPNETFLMHFLQHIIHP